MPAKFLYNLTKNLTAFLPHNLCAVLPKVNNPHFFDNFLKLFSTKKSKAKLREVRFRGRITAAMIYDDLRIIDVFRKVDENTVLGIMDFKGRLHNNFYFFVLKRQ